MAKEILKQKLSQKQVNAGTNGLQEINKGHGRLAASGFDGKISRLAHMQRH